MASCILLLTKHKEYKLSEPLTDIIKRKAVAGYVLGASFDDCLYKMYDTLRDSSQKGINNVCSGTVDENNVFHPNLKK